MSRNFLREKLFDLNMSQAQLAKKLGRDPATVNRWIKNNREISSINAVELSKILKCNPSEILFGSKSSTINITKTLDSNFEVKQISINKQRKISIPYEYNNKFTVAIINQSNVYNDGQILLYDEEKIDISKQMRSVGSSIIDYDKVLDFSIVNPFNLEVIKGYEKINTKKIKGIYKVKAEYYPDYC